MDGSFDYPFSDLEDALTKANELCSLVSEYCSVTIYLMKGDHYLLRYNRDYYMPTKLDKNHQIQKTVI